MSVTVPGSFTVLNPGTQFLPGKPVGEEPLATLGANSAYLWANYQCMVGSVIAPGANGWEPFQVSYSSAGVYIPRPACADRSDLLCTVFAHDKGDTDCRVKVSSYNSTGLVDSVESAALTGNVIHTVELTLGNSAEAGDIKLEGRTASGATTLLQLHSMTVHYAGFPGATVDAEQNCGVVLVGDHESHADYPVTDELISRMRRNPRRVWGDRRGLAALAASYTTDPLISTASGTRGGFLRGRTYLRHACNIRWWVYAVSAGGAWDVAITLNDGQTVVIDSGSETIDGAVTWRVDETACQEGWLDFTVDCLADGTHTLEVYTVAAEVIE